MLDTTTEVYAGLFNAVVRRLREADTIFGQRIKLVLRQLSDEQYALLESPYLLVVPTVTRVPPVRAVDQDLDSIINPRSIVFRAQLDGRGSEADWMAAVDIELVEKQLISSLVNWRPQQNYKPTTYAGMRVEATLAPKVKVAFVFTFYEELCIEENTGDDCCEEVRDFNTGMSTMAVRIASGGVPQPSWDSGNVPTTGTGSFVLRNNPTINSPTIYGPADLSVQTVVISGPALTIDRERGENCSLRLSESITSIEVVGWPAAGITGKLRMVINNADGLTMSGWPAGTIWPGGEVPDISTGTDIVLLMSDDGGVTIYGSVVGQDYR